MGIKSTGSVSFQEIANEFGGDRPHSFSEYYGDGAIIADLYFPKAPPLPKKADKGIKVSPFYGKSRRKRIVVELKSSNEGGDIYSYFRNEARNSQIPVDATLIISDGVYIGALNEYVLSDADRKKENASLYINAADESRNTSFASQDSLTIINNGFIIGNAGVGGKGSTGTKLTPSGPPPEKGIKGCYAMWLDFKTSIQNNGVIASGGAGGDGGKGSYENKILINSWYNCGPQRCDCNQWNWVKIPGDGGCAKASGQTGDCGDDKDISDGRCNGGKWWNNNRTCGCGNCRTQCRQICRNRCDEGGRGRNRWKRCFDDCREDRNCPNKSGPYYCACQGQCGGWSCYATDSAKCKNEKPVDIFTTGGTGGNGRGINAATVGTDSTPEAIASCKGQTGGEWGSTIAIVVQQGNLTLSGNAPVGGSGTV